MSKSDNDDQNGKGRKDFHDKDESSPGFMSFDDSREIPIEELMKAPGDPKEKPPKPPEKESPLKTERKKRSADFSFDLDFSPEHTRNLRKEAIKRRRAKKKKADEPPPSDLMTAPLVTESPHGKPMAEKETGGKAPSFENIEDSEVLDEMPPPPRAQEPGVGPAIALHRPPEPSPPGTPPPPIGVTKYVKVARVSARPESKAAALAGKVRITWYMYFLLVLLLGLAGIISFRSICNFDIWWHLSTGRDIIAAKTMPGNDPYSYTAADRTVFTPYPLAQVILASLDRAGGATALIIFKTVLVVLAFFLCVIAAPGKRRAGIIALWLALAALFASNSRLLVRPHLISLVMAPLFFLILERHERRSTKWIWVLPFASVLWANWHPSWIVGVLLVLAFLVGNAIFYFYGINYDERKAEAKRIGWLALLLVLVAAAGLVTPNHIHGFLHPFRQLTTLSVVNIGVGEWTSPVKGFTLLSTHLLYWKILIAIGVLSFLLNWKRQRLSHLLVFLGLLILSVTAYRHMALFALLAVPVAASNINAFLERQKLESVGKFTAALLGLLFAGAVAYYAVGMLSNDYYRSRKLYQFRTGTGVSGVHLPVAAVEEFKKLEVKGNGFHNYHLGGYLMYTLGPKTKVFLDGRFLHYPKSVMEDYRALKADPEKWAKISARSEYSFEWAMLAHTTGEFMGLIKILWDNADWQPVYVDSVVTLFVKKSGVNGELAKKIRPESLGKIRDYGSEEYEAFHYRQVGRLFTELGKFDWATNYLRKAQEMPYASREVKVDLGLVALCSGDAEGAKKIFESIYPKTYRIHIGLGEAELASVSPDIENARRHFERALELKRDSVEACLGLARVWYAKGRHLKAKHNIKKALEIDPDSAEALKLRKELIGEKK